MMTRRRRFFPVLALLLSATTLAGCGCGPFGLRWCHGGYHGGPYRGGPGYH